MHPTETGIVVIELLTNYFPNIVDVNFTAEMEADLDRIASGDQEWVEIVRDFYAPFAEQVEIAEEEMQQLHLFDYVVVSQQDRIELAVLAIEAIIIAEKHQVVPREISLPD